MILTDTTSPTLLKDRILFVDDEAALLQGVKRSLRATRGVWECEFVDTPAAALDLMQHTTFQVVVSDMQMPGMNGAEFLAQARQVSPETVRVMLTGNADLKTALAAVNQGHIFQLLLKPCQGDQLIQTLTAALLQHRLQLAECELLRTQLENSDKMVTVGKLAAGITHDLNNILGAILIQSELAVLDSQQNSTANSGPALNLIHEAAKSAAALTRELNSFSRCERIGAFQSVPVPALIEAILRITRPLLSDKVKLHTEFTPDLPALLGDAEKLKQAIMNLLLNARDAMPEGGEIWISAQKQSFAAPEAAAGAGRRAGDFVCLTVRDTGFGMDAATQQRILQSGFTTKPAGKGTGLGLFMVRRVAGQHDGWVELESAVGQGTSFRIYLPARTS